MYAFISVDCRSTFRNLISVVKTFQNLLWKILPVETNDAELSRELKSDINNDYGELEEVDHEDPLREDSPVPAPISSEAPVSSTSNSPKSSIRRTKIVSKIVLPQVGENILCINLLMIIFLGRGLLFLVVLEKSQEK